MRLSKYKLGELTERSTANNRTLEYGVELIAGVNNDGVFTIPKGDPIDVDLKPYKIVNDGAFVYNPTRLELGSIAHRTSGRCIVSHLYQVFYLNAKGKEILDPVYLFMFFRRDEFYRQVKFRNFGSQRPEFSYSDMAEIEITLPPIEHQRKFVNVYMSLQKNIEAYQSKIEELKIVCDGYLDQLKAKSKKEKVGELLGEVDCRNSGSKITSVMGINIEKKFMDSVADTNGVDLSKYKIVHKNEFAFSGMQTGRDECIRIALNEEDEPLIVSPAYTVLKLKNSSVLCHYIMLWFSRKEIDRYGWFASDGSIRSNLDLERFYEMEIPTPSLDIQKNVVKIYCCYLERQRIAAELKEQLHDLCPILIKGSLLNNN